MQPSMRGSGSHPENPLLGSRLCHTPYQSHWRSHSVSVSDAESQSLAKRQSAGRARGAGNQGQFGKMVVPEPLQSWNLGSYSPSGDPRFPLGGDGCPCDNSSIWLRNPSSSEEGHFLLSNDQQASLNGCHDLTFSSCAHISFSF